MLKKYSGNLPQCLHFLGIEFHGKIPQYVSFLTRANEITLFAMVMHCHSLAITEVI
jgi:hypothetical protein